MSQEIIIRLCAKIIIIMLSLTSVSASEDDIGDMADEFMLPCQRVHAMTVTVYMAGIRTEVAGLQASRLDHSATAVASSLLPL